MDEDVYIDVHSEFENAGCAGAFFPNTLLMYLAFPDILSRSYPPAVMTFWHEYMHFLQYTTTTYGLNMFMRELELAQQLIGCIQDLHQITSEITFPLELWCRERSKRSIRRMLKRYVKYRGFVEDDLATIQGACSFDQSTQRLMYRGKPLANQQGCPCMYFYEDPVYQVPIPVGARAIMEGMVTAFESLYEILQAYMFSSRERSRWQTEVEASKQAKPHPLYDVTINMATRYFGDEDDGGLAKLLAISDLALFPPVEFESVYADDVQRYPGRRFYAAMAAAQKIPNFEINDFHDNYKDFIGDVCARLGWQTPWETISESLIERFEKQFLSKTTDSFQDLIGPVLVLLNGLRLRREWWTYCANPTLNFAECQRVQKKRGPVIVLWQQPYAIHPPPFVKTPDGNRSLTCFIDSMAAQIGIERTKLAARIEHSFQQYFFMQNLSRTLWSGVNMCEGKIKCLQYCTEKSEGCHGYFVNRESAIPSSCPCRDMFADLVGFSPDDARWLLP